MLTDALGGEKGPVADCLMLNAGVAMAAAAQAESVEEGVAMCKEAHAQGKGGDTSGRGSSFPEAQGGQTRECDAVCSTGEGRARRVHVCSHHFA